MGSNLIRSKRPREVSTLHASASAAASDAAVDAAASTAAADDGARLVSAIEESNSNAVRLASNEPRRSSASCASRRT